MNNLRQTTLTVQSLPVLALMSVAQLARLLRVASETAAARESADRVLATVKAVRG